MNQPAIASASQLAAYCRASYADFCRLMQDDGWFDPVHERVCDRIQQELEESGNLAALRQDDDSLSKRESRFLVVMPRGSLKSTIITKYLPIWITLQSSKARSLIAGNSATNATKKLNGIRGVFDTNEVFRALFSELLPNDNCQWTDTCATVPRARSFDEGTFEAAGTKTRVVGRHYNFINEDDTVAPEKDDLNSDISLPSTEDVERAIGWHKMAGPLLVTKGPRVRMVVTTRWCDYDIVVHIKEKERGYVVMDIPAEVDGVAQFSCFYDKERLAEIAETLGPYMYSCLFLNNPIPAGDRTFSNKWFQSYKPKQVPETAKYYVSVDPAISQSKSACETAIVGAYHEAGYLWVQDVYHKRYTPFELIATALDLCEKYRDRVAGLIIETVNYQQSLIYYLHDEMRRREIYVPIIEAKSRSSKDVRIEGLQPLYANGQVYHRSGIDSSLETQLIAYPQGKLVDIVDALSMHLLVYRGKPAPAKPVQAEETNELMEALAVLRRRGKHVCGFSDPFAGGLREGIPSLG